jgi:diguanylate cyclase (GGDEF)-like protein
VADNRAFSSANALPPTDPVRWLTWGYVLALAIIGFMSVGIHLTIDRIVAEQDSVATIVSKSAGQIPLAQRVALNATKYINQKDRVSRDRIKETTEKMRTLHASLVRQSLGEKSDHNRAPDALMAIYFDPPYFLNDKIISFLDHADRLAEKNPSRISVSDPDYLYIMKQVDGSLGDALSAALYSYETSIVTKINKLQSFQRMAIFVIIATLIAEAFFIFMPLVKRVRNYAEELKLITMTDLLTGVGNRRHFVFRGNQEIQRCRRLKKDLCLALIDLDRFKDINDSYGHKSGDMVLQQFVQVAQRCIRLEDVFARVGGEEFAVLLPHTGIEDAVKVIERMREAVEASDFELDNNFKSKLTMSAGLTRVNLSRDDFETALVLADVALYDAKRTGRNKVVFKEAETFFENEISHENVVPIKPA